MHIYPPKRLVDWLVARAKRDPLPSIYHPKDGLYMERFNLKHWRYLWLRLHITWRSDADKHRHDHPWWSISWILDNGYFEQYEDHTELRWRGDIVFRRATTSHRLDLTYDETLRDGTLLPCVSLFITGPKVQSWSFIVDGAKVPWRQYIAERDSKESFTETLSPIDRRTSP